MGKLSREKGKRGERAVCDLLIKAGFAARRGQQFKGTKDSPDVIHSMWDIDIEAKWRQQWAVYDWLEKLNEEGSGRPVVFAKRDRQPVVVLLYAEDFLQLMKELYNV